MTEKHDWGTILGPAFKPLLDHAIQPQMDWRCHEGLWEPDILRSQHFHNRLTTHSINQKMRSGCTGKSGYPFWKEVLHKHNSIAYKQ